MEKDRLITGVKIAQQMSKARNILNSQVIPREELYQIREREGRLSQELIRILKKMPNLIIIAGCNGAGKSTFASSFLQDGLTSFDYDRLYL